MFSPFLHSLHTRTHTYSVDFSIIHCFHVRVVFFISISPFVCSNLWVYYVPLKINKGRKDQTRAFFFFFVVRFVHSFYFIASRSVSSHPIQFHSIAQCTMCTICKTVYDTFNDKHTKENWIMMAPLKRREWSDFLRFVFLRFVYSSIFCIWFCDGRNLQSHVFCKKLVKVNTIPWQKTQQKTKSIEMENQTKFEAEKTSGLSSHARARSWWSVSRCFVREQSTKKNEMSIVIFNSTLCYDDSSIVLSEI